MCIQFIKRGGGDNKPIEITGTHDSDFNPKGGYVSYYIKNINPIKVTKAGCNFLFAEFHALESATINFEVKPTKMKQMFYDCKKLTDIKFVNLDSSDVDNMSNMFALCEILETIPQLDTSSVTNMEAMFYCCYKLKSVPQLNTSNVTNMSSMFKECRELTAVPQLNTSNVTSMSSMFYNCKKITEIPQLNTSNVTDMSNMFRYCEILETIPQLDTSKVTKLSMMFGGCNSLSNESLNNILAMCINATSYTGTKSLYYLGFSSRTIYPASRMEALPNYQAFIDAGWVLGY